MAVAFGSFVVAYLSFLNAAAANAGAKASAEAAEQSAGAAADQASSVREVVRQVVENIAILIRSVEISETAAGAATRQAKALAETEKQQEAVSRGQMRTVQFTIDNIETDTNFGHKLTGAFHIANIGGYPVTLISIVATVGFTDSDNTDANLLSRYCRKGLNRPIRTLIQRIHLPIPVENPQSILGVNADKFALGKITIQLVAGVTYDDAAGRQHHAYACNLVGSPFGQPLRGCAMPVDD